MQECTPFITVVVPVRNEARFIRATLESLLTQDYPADRFELIVADGMSDDGTREIVASLAQEHGNLRLEDNPGRRSSAGRNVGFRKGKGELFLVVDGHCHIPTDQLLRNLVECFEKSGAGCLGRPQPLDPPGLTPFQQAVALARASRFGHGDDSLIYGDFEGFASPVSNGAAYRREVFQAVGYVNEDFDACEDVEFNLRVEQAGIRAYSSPKLSISYFPRETLGGLLGQMRRYGRGRVRLYRLHPRSLRLSAGAPFLFVGGLGLTGLLAVLRVALGPSPVLAWLLTALLACIGLYALLSCWFTVSLCRAGGDSHKWRLPAIFFTIHAGLGLGMWEELTQGRRPRPVPLEEAPV